MAFPTYGLLGAGSAMLQAPPGSTPGQVAGQGLSGFLSGVPADTAAQQTSQKRKTLADVRQAWLSGAKSLAENNPQLINYLSKTATAESGNQNIPQGINATGSAFGPFQFTEGTWRDQITKHPELGLTERDRFSPAAQGRVAVTFTRDNQTALRGALRRDPTPGELLLAHRFGAQGAISLLNTPRTSSVAAALPQAVAANPQWSKMTVAQIIGETDRAAGSPTPENAAAQLVSEPRGGGGLLGSSPTPTPGSSTDGMAALFGGVPLAPMGTALQNMTPEFRNILAIALGDPSLGPVALQTILQAGLSGGGGGAPAIKPTDKIINALATGKRPGTPEFEAAVLGSGEEKPTDIMKEAKALYPDDPAAQKKFIEDYRAKAGVKVDIGQPASPNPVIQEEFKTIMDTGRTANSALAEIAKARQALKNLPTGVGREYQNKAQMWLKALGLDPTILGPDITTNAQLLTAISIPMALRVRMAGTGQMSDREQALYQAATIGLDKDPRANEFILDDAEINARRALEERKFATQFVKDHNGVTIDLPAALDEWRAAHPLYDEKFYKKWEPILLQPKTTTPTITPVAPGTSTSPEGTAPKRWKLQGGQLVPE